jgi:hypothetical protein
MKFGKAGDIKYPWGWGALLSEAYTWILLKEPNFLTFVFNLRGYFGPKKDLG